MIYENHRQKTYLRTYAPSEVSEQPAHSHSLIRIFTGHIYWSQGCKVASRRQQRLIRQRECAVWFKSLLDAKLNSPSSKFKNSTPVILHIILLHILMHNSDYSVHQTVEWKINSSHTDLIRFRTKVWMDWYKRYIWELLIQNKLFYASFEGLTQWTLVTTIAFVPKDVAIKRICCGKKSLNVAGWYIRKDLFCCYCLMEHMFWIFIWITSIKRLSKTCFLKYQTQYFCMLSD